MLKCWNVENAKAIYCTETVCIPYEKFEDENLVIVHEVAENGRIVTEREDKIKAIIKETINQYLKDNLV